MSVTRNVTAAGRSIYGYPPPPDPDLSTSSDEAVQQHGETLTTKPLVELSSKRRNAVKVSLSSIASNDE